MLSYPDDPPLVSFPVFPSLSMGQRVTNFLNAFIGSPTSGLTALHKPDTREISLGTPESAPMGMNRPGIWLNNDVEHPDGSPPVGIARS